MKKTLIVGLLGVLLGVAAGAGVQAQTPDTTVQKPISIKIGAFFPGNGTLKSATHNTWVKVGADYAFSKTNTANPLLTSGYVDYTGSSGSGNHASVVGVGVAARDYFSTTSAGSGTSFSPYAGVGIGAYFSHASGGGNTKDNTQIGGKIFLGAELNSGPFVEAAYNILPQSTHIGGSNIKYDGFDVSVGYRF